MTPANNNPQQHRASQQDLGFKNPYFWMGVLFFFGGLLLISTHNILLQHTNDITVKIVFYVVSIGLLVRGLTQILYTYMFFIQKKSRESINIPDSIHNTEHIGIDIPGWRGDDIPKGMVNTFDALQDKTYILTETTSLGKIRTLYLHTTIKREKQSVITNNCLLLEHTFGAYIPKGTTNQKKTYVYIRPDMRDNMFMKLFSFFALPALLIYMYGQISEQDVVYIKKLIDSFGIDSSLFFVVILLIIGYISYLVLRRNIFHHAVTMEHRMFEKLFDVDSNDPILARQICNPLFFEKIQQRVQDHELKECILYIDFTHKRVIQKFDYKTQNNMPHLSEEFIRKQILLSVDLLQTLQIEKTMHLHPSG